MPTRFTSGPRAVEGEALPPSDPVQAGVERTIQELAQAMNEHVENEMMSAFATGGGMARTAGAPLTARWPAPPVHISDDVAEEALQAWRRSGVNMQSFTERPAQNTPQQVSIDVETDWSLRAAVQSSNDREDALEYAMRQQRPAGWVRFDPSQNIRNTFYTASQIEEFRHQQQQANEVARAAALVQELRDYYGGAINRPTPREVERRLENNYNVRGSLGNSVLQMFFYSLRLDEQSRGPTHNYQWFDEAGDINKMMWPKKAPEPPMDEPI